MLHSPLHSLDKASLLRFHADEGGHDGAHTELRDIASEDGSQQRTGYGAGHFFSEVAAYKVGHGFVMIGGRCFELSGAFWLLLIGEPGLRN